MTPSLILGGRGGGGDSTPLSSTPWNVAASKKSQLGRRQQDGSCEQTATANIIFRLAAVENSHLACLRPWAARSSDLEQPIRDWQNICIIATENDLIDLSGDFEYPMYDLLVEELLQGSDADSSLQTVEQNILDEPIAD